MTEPSDVPARVTPADGASWEAAGLTVGAWVSLPVPDARPWWRQALARLFRRARPPARATFKVAAVSDGVMDISPVDGESGR